MYIYCDPLPASAPLSELARPQPPQYFSSICMLCWHFQVLSCTAGHPLFLCVTFLCNIALGLQYYWSKLGYTRQGKNVSERWFFPLPVRLYASRIFYFKILRSESLRYPFYIVVHCIYTILTACFSFTHHTVFKHHYY